MFDAKGFIQALGISILLTVIVSFIIGTIQVLAMEWTIIISFLVSYISIGIFGPMWNRKAPYFAAFLGGITLTVINFLFSIFVLRIPVFLNPDVVRDNLTV